MSRGLGVVKYCTPEGGSGYIANSVLPWLSSFDITQQSPNYTQGPGWLRDTRPGSFTYYHRFGPPYSIDGGVLPPYRNDGFDGAGPEPVETGCGMGDLTLLRSDVVAPMPSITSTARTGCVPVTNCPEGIAGWVQSNPWLAALLAMGAVLVIGMGGRKR